MRIEDIKIKINLDTINIINSLYKGFITENNKVNEHFDKAGLSILQVIFDKLQKRAVTQNKSYTITLKYFEAYFLSLFLRDTVKASGVYEQNLTRELISQIHKKL